MKKTLKKLAIFLTIIIGSLCLLGGCRLYKGNFFDRKHLEQNFIPDLPKPQGKLKNDKGDSIECEMSEEAFNAYVNEVYDYLVSCNFYKFGTSYYNRGGFSNQTIECFELEDFKSEYGSEENGDKRTTYMFVWKNEPDDEIKYDPQVEYKNRSYYLIIAYHHFEGYLYFELSRAIPVSYFGSTALYTLEEFSQQQRIKQEDLIKISEYLSQEASGDFPNLFGGGDWRYISTAYVKYLLHQKDPNGELLYPNAKVSDIEEIRNYRFYDILNKPIDEQNQSNTTSYLFFGIKNPYLELSEREYYEVIIDGVTLQLANDREYFFYNQY